MIPRDDLRFEVKLVAPEDYLPRLHAALRLNPTGLSVLYPPRHINNVYLDSLDLSRTNQNYLGAAHRCKVRYRWYGQDLEAAGTVEFKHKHAALGWKRNYRLTQPIDLGNIDWNQFLRRLQQDLPEEAWMDMHNLTQAVLINRYHREYFATPDRRVRVTVDTRQRFYSQWATQRPNLTFESMAPRWLVVEIKANRSEADAVDRVVQALPLSVTKNSKYLTGVEASCSLR